MKNTKETVYKGINIPSLINDFNKVLANRDMKIISYINDFESGKLQLFIRNSSQEDFGYISILSKGLDSYYDWIFDNKIVRFYNLSFMKRFFYESIDNTINNYDENENLMYRHIESIKQ